MLTKDFLRKHATKDLIFLSRKTRRELGTRPSSDTIYLTAEQVTDIGERFDKIRQQIIDDLGEQDRKYITYLIRTERYLDAVGRLAILVAGRRNSLRYLGAMVLGIAKIIDNMEIGHNVLHGQYDHIGEPGIHSSTFEWDNMCPARQWKITHNFRHHKYTNIEGLDQDLGFNILRVTRSQQWRKGNLGNLLYCFLLMSFFEIGVTGHIAEINEFWEGDKKFKDKIIELIPIAQDWSVKGAPQLLRDFVLFPLLRPKYYRKSARMNFLANRIRDVWAHAIIFCGHFPEEIQTFTLEETANETRGEWYVRQLLGSGNLYGSKLFHFFTGNLSHQIEHHLYPDIPAYRYAGIAKEVRKICEEFNLPYNNGPFLKQISSVWIRLAKGSLPNRFSKPKKKLTIIMERAGQKAPEATYTQRFTINSPVPL